MPDLAQQIRDRLDLPGAHDLPRNAIRAVLSLHRPIRIYDECGHQHAEGDPGTVDVEEVGLVCEEGFGFLACDECCREDGYVTEHCSSNHDPIVPCWPCPTISEIATALGIEVPS